MKPVLVVLDVDGVVSPVHGKTAWGDDVVGGRASGDVRLSPTLVVHLDVLSMVPGVRCVWLTDWTPRMRDQVASLPGRDWPALRHHENPPPLRPWWKLTALETWLARQAEDQGGQQPYGSVVWVDDHLRWASRQAACRRRLEALGLESLLIAPRTTVGITPPQMSAIGEWVQARVEKRYRYILNAPWRASARAPCGCAWDGQHCPHCGLVTDTSGDAWSPVHTIRCHSHLMHGITESPADRP